jgi:hypothetical protein
LGGLCSLLLLILAAQAQGSWCAFSFSLKANPNQAFTLSSVSVDLSFVISILHSRSSDSGDHSFPAECAFLLASDSLN